MASLVPQSVTLRASAVSEAIGAGTEASNPVKPQSWSEGGAGTTTTTTTTTTSPKPKALAQAQWKEIKNNLTAFSNQHHGPRTDPLHFPLAAFPPDIAHALREDLKVQGDEITLQELGHGAILLHTEKRRVKWLVCAVFWLVVLLFGATVASAVLAQRLTNTMLVQPSSQSKSAVLTDLSGATARTAAGALPAAIAFTPAAALSGSVAGGKGSRALWAHAAAAVVTAQGGAVVREQPAGAPLPLVHRRLEAGGGGVAAASSGGSGDSAARSLQGASAAAGAPLAAAPPALLPLGTLPTSTAALVCALLSEGNAAIVMPLPTALGSGGGSGGAVASGTANFIPSTAQGCGADLLTAPLGFTADFTMVLAADQVPVLFNVDCPGPLAAATAVPCTVSRVLLTPTFSHLALPAREAWLDPALLALPLNPAATSSSGIAAFVYNATVCNLGQALPFPALLSQQTSPAWRASLVNGSCSAGAPSDRAACACAQSPPCMLGAAATGSTVYRASLWASAGAFSTAAGQLLAGHNLTYAALAAASGALSAQQHPNCRATYAVTYTLPGATLTGAGPPFLAKAWSGNPAIDVPAISDTCANACEVLQYYFWWRPRYWVRLARRANPSAPGGGLGTKGPFADYCTAASLGGGAYSEPGLNAQGRLVSRNAQCGGGDAPACYSVPLQISTSCSSSL